MGVVRERPEMVADTPTLTPTNPPDSGANAATLRRHIEHLEYLVKQITEQDDFRWDVAGARGLKRLFELGQETRNHLLIGGGTIFWSAEAAGKVKWSQRFLFLPADLDYGSSGHIDIVMPTSGVTDDTGAERANSQGILINDWEGLWFIHARGGGSATGNSFKVLPYYVGQNQNYFADPDAYLLCVRNGDNSVLAFRNGLHIPYGGSVYTNQAGSLPYATETIIGAMETSDYNEAKAGSQSWGSITPLRARNQADARAWKSDVRCATTANITLSGTQTVDGVALVVDDRVLVKNQTDPVQNGIWVVQAGAWYRATDLETSYDTQYGVTVRIRSGTTNTPGQLYYMTSALWTNPSTQALNFAVQPGAPAAVADASTSQKGASKLSSAPVVSTDPIAVSVNDPIFDTHIDGLDIAWDSLTTLAVEPGAAWIQAANRVVNIPSRLTVTNATPGANTKRYLYLVYNTGTGAVTLEADTVAPTTYSNKARNKNGDTTRRYVGMAVGNGTNTGFWKFRRYGDWIYYLENHNQAPFEIVGDGLSGTEANLVCSGCVPPSSRMAEVWFFAWEEAYLSFGNSEDTFTLNAADPGPGGASVALFTNYNIYDHMVFRAQLDASQTFTYKWSSARTAGNGISLYVRGYQEER